MKRQSRKRNYVESMTSTSAKASTKTSTESTVSKRSAATVPKVITAAAFSYEIDCNRVRTSINVIDLVSATFSF